MNPSSEVLPIVVLIIHLACLTSAQTNRVVRIEEGLLVGSVMQSRLGLDFDAFRGIPFAEAPIGALRFKDPVPKEPWADLHFSTSFGAVCMQGAQLPEPMSEDCLFLNVFTRNLPLTSNPQQQLLPVIAFLHGGGMEFGSSNLYGPEYLMEREVVVVTINYRLGVFGNLALGTADFPGNAAMKDQALALKWIKRNIAAFGGDPEKVTLGGLSAGAHTATAHMVSPMSDGLFHNLLGLSGAMAWQIELKTDTIDSSRTLAQKINCPTENIDDMVQCFMDKPASELANNMVHEFMACPLRNWYPVVEPDFGSERFLTDQPLTLFKNGNFSRVNVMVGITADEFVFSIADLFKNASYIAALNERFAELGPACFGFEGNNHKSKEEVARILWKTYINYDTIDVRSFTGLKNLLSDSLIGYGVHRFVHLISNFTDVYYFRFSYSGDYSRFYYPRQKPYGVHHIDDIQYTFYGVFDTPLYQQNDTENIIVERMTRMWQSFATTGNPNNVSDVYLADMVWPKHDAESEFFLDIGSHLVEKNGMYLDRFNVWDSLDINTGSSGLKITANVLILFIALLLSSVFIYLK